MNGLKILGILAALVLAVVVGLIVVLNSIDWSAYQEPIVAAVEDATGRKLGVDGAIGVSIGLSPRVSVDGVSFQNAPFGSRPSVNRTQNRPPLSTGSRALTTPSRPACFSLTNTTTACSSTPRASAARRTSSGSASRCGSCGGVGGGLFK